MKTQYTNLVELAEAVEANRKARRDFIADTRQVRMTEEGGLAVPVPSHGVEVFHPTDHAHGQVAARLNIPKAYYDRMRATEPKLLAHNVNTWFDKTPERRLIRTRRDMADAFLSDRYQRIDCHHVLAMVLPIFREIPGLTVRSLALTETKMYLKATVPALRGEVKVGDIVEGGIEVSTGEIGNGAFIVGPFLNRLRCLNGLKMPEAGFKRHHVGARADVSEDVYEWLSDETLMADDHAIMLKARDVIRGVLSSDGFQKILGKLQASTEDKLEGNPAKAVEVLADRFSLREDEAGAVLRHLIEGGDLSRWGVVNAVTRTAQDVESYDRSDELEGFGGKLIELPRSEWKELAKAA